MNVVDMRCKISLDNRIHNEDIHRMTGISEDVTVKMKKNLLSWFWHVERMSDERMTKKIYDGKVSGKRGRGRLRWTFERRLQLNLLIKFAKSVIDL